MTSFQLARPVTAFRPGTGAEPVACTLWYGLPSACWYSTFSVSGAIWSSTACHSTWISPLGFVVAWTSSRGGAVSTTTRSSGRNVAPAEITVPTGIVRDANQYSPS